MTPLWKRLVEPIAFVIVQAGAIYAAHLPNPQRWVFMMSTFFFARGLSLILRPWHK